MSQVVHAIGSLTSDKGGPSRTVPRLCAELRDDGRWAPLLLCTDPPGTVLPTTGIAAQCTGGGMGFWRALDQALGTCGATHAIVHDHGLWLANNAMAGVQALRRPLPLVISPRGMLQSEAMGHRAWKKQLAMATYQAALLRRATAFHATSLAEVERLRALGLRQPVLMLANAVDMPALGRQPPAGDGRRRALFLSRIHPHKGVLELLQAWAGVSPTGWRLTLAGPGDPEFRSQVASRVATMPARSPVELLDAIADDAKWALYASSDLVVLPSRSENFGVVVAEALACGVPVLTTTGTPWSQLPVRGCGWQVAPDARSLARALHEATVVDDAQLRAMGARGREWMRSDYSWQGVGRHLADAYDWLAAGQPPDNPPAGIHLA
jgi:glycosyltransferase involved in cell wall biosynthesis